MANDREVLKVVWEGKIPAKFVTEDDRDNQEQDSYFLMLPRVSYLPLVTDKVRLIVTAYPFILDTVNLRTG